MPHVPYTRLQILTNFLQGSDYYYAHFIAEEMKAQRGDVTCLKTHSCMAQSQDLNPGVYDLKSHAHNPKALEAATPSVSP